MKAYLHAYNLLNIFRSFYLKGKEVRRANEWIIKRLSKFGAEIAYRLPRVNPSYSVFDRIMSVDGSISLGKAL